MFKYSQSLLDFLRTFPIPTEREALTKKEAQTLMEIWQHGGTDEYGYLIVPNNSDSLQVSSLATKGFIKSKSNNRIATAGDNNKIEITEKGKEFIKKTVLQEESAFNLANKTTPEFFHANPMKKANRIASNWMRKI